MQNTAFLISFQLRAVCHKHLKCSTVVSNPLVNLTQVFGLGVFLLFSNLCHFIARAFLNLDRDGHSSVIGVSLSIGRLVVRPTATD